MPGVRSAGKAVTARCSVTAVQDADARGAPPHPAARFWSAATGFRGSRRFGVERGGPEARLQRARSPAKR